MKQMNYPGRLLMTALLCCSGTSYAQMVGADVFLKGNYVEVGIAPNGAFGSQNAPPAGYHPRPAFALGFVSDPAKDGWTVGTPAYVGDYFVPGDPQEGWDMYVDGLTAKAWRGIAGGPTSMTGGLTGANVSYTSTGGVFTGVWEGNVAGLAIRQRTILPENKLYFIIKVTIKNTTSSPINNIYYNRTLDPDNESTMGGGAVTNNKIIFNLPNKQNKSLVTGVGTTFNSYLGLGSKDCRAKPYILDAGLNPAPGDTLNLIYEQNNALNYNYKKDSLTVGDVGIGLAFKIGTLAPGDSTNLSYAYVLSEADLDSAFFDMSPVWQYDGQLYESGDTVKLCRPYGASPVTVPLNIYGGNEYTWAWSPRPGLKNLTGVVNETVLDFTPITYVAKPSGSFGCIDSMVLTVIPYYTPPKPGVVTPVRFCQHDSPTPLTATTTPGSTLRWYTTATGGTPLLSVTPPTNAVDTYTYYVSQINGICESERARIDVYVHPLPSFDQEYWL